MTKRDWWWIVLVGAVTAAAAFAGVHWPIAAPIAVGSAILVGIAGARPNFLAPVLVLAAIPLMRPNTFGEWSSLWAMCLCIAAALVAFLADRRAVRLQRSFVAVGLFVAAMYLWMALIYSQLGDIPRSVWQGMELTVIPVACVAVVCGNRERLLLFGKMFIWLMLALCASYAVTALVWVVFGVGAFPLTSYSSYANGIPATLYFPFTPSVGGQGIGGVTFPRFGGLGREPGWMGMYCAVALLIWSRVGKPRLWGQALLLVGLLGTFSTAGFGALMVGLGVAWLFRRSKTEDIAMRYFWFLVKLAFLAAALWVAVYAPVLGFAAKGDYNAMSLSDRQIATNNGIAAFFTHPMGGLMSGNLAAINLVAAIAPFGVPFFLIVMGALLVPRLGHPAARLTTAPVFVVLVTLLLSQPAGDSTFVFVLVALVYALATTRKTEEAPAVEHRLQAGPKCGSPLSR